MVLTLLSSIALLSSPTGPPAGPTPSEPALGKVLPPFDMTLVSAPNGAKADWASLKGRAVVLEFWATWCAPCVDAVPHLNQLADKFKGRPIQFVSVSIEPGRETAVRSFLKKVPMRSWVGVAGKGMIDAYKGRQVPETFLVDRTGKLVAITHPSKVTERVLEDLIEGRDPGLGNSRRPAAKPPEAAEPKADEKPTPPYVRIAPCPPETRSGSAIGPQRWQGKGMDAASVLSVALGVPMARIQIDGTLPTGKYTLDAAFPEEMSAEEKHTLGALVVPQALGFRAKKQTTERETLVLTCPEGPRGEFRENDQGGRAGSGPGFSSGVAAVPILISRSLEGDLGLPVIDEMGLKGRRYDWNLIYKAGDVDAAIAALRAMGIVATRAKRRIDGYALSPLRKKENGGQ
jgi:thiol-disulfide isomerase/thioredoxin